MCFKRFTAKYVVGGADSVPPLNEIGLSQGEYYKALLRAKLRLMLVV